MWRNPYPDLFSIFGAADGKSLWAVGEDGAILHSSDGENWKPQASGTSKFLRSINGTTDGKSLWAVGEDGAIVHSSDGENWKPQTSGTSNWLDLIYRTTDGKSFRVLGVDTLLYRSEGEMWKPRNGVRWPVLNSIWASGRSLWGVGPSGTILYSADGETWKPQSSGTFGNLHSIYGMSGGKSLWAVGEKGTILHSTDGETWKPQSSGTPNGLSSIYGTPDGKSLWAVGDAGIILHSTDGETWKPQSSGTPNGLNSIYGTPDGKSLWAVGSGATILHSADGQTWKRQSGVPSPSYLTSIYGTADRKLLWAVGGEGTILHRVDGQTWKRQNSGTGNSLLSIHGKPDGKSLWAVGEGGTILYSADGDTWKAQNSGTSNALNSIYVAPDGRSLWAVGDNGTILYGTDGETWKPQSSGTRNQLASVYGTTDGKSLWAVGSLGTILHSTDGEIWKPQNSGTPKDLRSIYGTADGKSLWAVGDAGTILHSKNGATWDLQNGGTISDFHSIYGTADGKSLWAVGTLGTILHSTGGELWKPQSSGASVYLYSGFVTNDGNSAWVVGNAGVILHGESAGRHPYIQGARFGRGIAGPTLNLNIACSDQQPEPLSLEITGRNPYKFRAQKEGSVIGDAKKPPRCGAQDIPVNLDDLEMGSGQTAHFDITFNTGEDSTLYRFEENYDPWRWFIDHWKQLAIAGALLTVVATFALLLRFRPLWNLRLYQFLRLPQIDKLSRIPSVGAGLQTIVNLCTIGLPWFVTHSRTLDAWVAGQRNLIAQTWGEETLPGRAAASSQQRAIESTSYIPLPVRLADPQSGTEIPEPSAGEISRLFSDKRTLIEVIGPGGAGKTTFARQVGQWALLGGRPGGFPHHAMLPVWIDEDMSAREKPLTDLVKGKLAALLPEEKLDEAFLEALLRKQRLLIILDRLSERSVTTQQYIGSIYRSTRVEALLITARAYIPVGGATPATIYPQALNQDSLLHFMTSLLKPGSGNEEADAKASLSLDEQLCLGKKLADLYRTSVRSDGTEAPVLPLPVRLFVEEARRIIGAGRSLDQLPLSIPEVYSRYLEQVNPEEPSLPNFMTHPEMLRAATILAKLAVAGDFIPKEFYSDEAADELRKAGWPDSQKLDPVRRLIDNGILIEKGPLVSRRLRFALDPIAENLAAEVHVRECKRDPVCLQKFRDAAANAPGFLAAIDLMTRSV